MKGCYRFWLWICLLATAVGCEAGPEQTEDSLLVLAASSLRAVMPALTESFTAATGTEVSVSYGSTAALAAQIENGAPADLVLTADEVAVDRLVAGGYVREADRATFARGRLVIAWRGGGRPLDGIDDLVRPDYEVIAIANPALAPYGRAAMEAMTAARLLPEIGARLVVAESVSQAMQLVLSGNADAGFVAESLLPGLHPTPGHLPVDPDLHSPIKHVAARVAESRHPRAGEFLALLETPGAREVLERFGFSVSEPH